MTDDYIYLFWDGWASQWYSCRFTIDNVEYNCAEQFMMASKAKLFNDFNILIKIMNSPYPKAQKRFGRLVSGFNDIEWKAVAKDIVFKGNYAKFTQNLNLKSKLLETGDRLIVEASPYDCIWGIGLSEYNPDSKDPSKWRGSNWLGEVLMQVRSAITVENNI